MAKEEKRCWKTKPQTSMARLATRQAGVCFRRRWEPQWAVEQGPDRIVVLWEGTFGGGGGRGLVGVEGEEVGGGVEKRLVAGQEEWDVPLRRAVAARVAKRPKGRDPGGVGWGYAGRKAGSPGACWALPQSGLGAGSHPRRWG